MRLKHLPRLVVGFACVGMLSTATIAQEAEREAEVEAQEQRRDNAAEEPTAKAQTGKSQHGPRTRKKTGRDDDVFRPSEEISEDFAVSFPVDI